MDLKKTLEIRKIKDGSPEELLEQCGAIWIYGRKDREPHAILTSGKHSDGYINLNAALQFTNICRIFAEKLIQRLTEEEPRIKNLREEIDVVVSSSFAALTLGQEVARQLGAMFVFTEKEGKDQKWTGRFEIPKGVAILQVEDLITTLSTTRKVKEAISNNNPQVEFLEIDGKIIVATIVYRPDKFPVDEPDYWVIPLIVKEIHNWSPEECPLCKKGSPALKPKPNWQRFLEHR